MKSLTRRDFVRKSALATASATIASELQARTSSNAVAAAVPRAAASTETVPLHWLEGGRPAASFGSTWGVSWPRGRHGAGATFSLKTNEGVSVPVQSWPLATWPDGSLKWTAHAVAGNIPAESFELAPGAAASGSVSVRVSERNDHHEIDTGTMKVWVSKSGRVLIPSIVRQGREALRNGRLVVLNQDSPEFSAKVEAFDGDVTAVTIEQDGPVRAVVKIEGRHRSAGGDDRAWLPFVVRLYFHAGSDAIRVMHTFIFDGDQHKDFIRGIGLRFSVPIEGELHDRHVRFSGQGEGVFAEAVRGITGLRRDPGEAVRKAQLAGEATPPLETWAKAVSSRLSYIAAYNDWTLHQANADGFDLHKRTGEGCTWLTAAQGQRAGGLGYVGSPRGGVAFGIRNFWQSHPAQLDIRGATREVTEVTAWLWAPRSAPMDLRPYHDGLGQDTYEKQYNGGLEITYEDYEPGFDNPAGVARTSELHLWILEATPGRQKFADLAECLRNPPQLVTTPEHLHACEVFGNLWTPEDRSTPARRVIEDRLALNFSYYHGQREDRRWYGFWNYGDVMHTYDAYRHEWRYDVGGFAWDNSELSTDIWLWLYFLRTGRADVFRFAEAMTRHTGEVDVYHVGRFAPLGSRHNVLHWGCSAKQLRISTAVNRRYYYYLTGDERVGDLMRAQIEAGRALLRVPPGRKLSVAKTAGDLDRGASTDVTRVGVSVGTDWGSLAGAWLTEWERTRSEKMRDRLMASMISLGRQPHGFFSTGMTLNLETGEFSMAAPADIGVSHLNAVFGLVEVCAELIQLLDVPGFRKAWLEYCELYNASDEEQVRRLGRKLTRGPLVQGHSRLTAYAAKLMGDSRLAQRAWSEFARDPGGRRFTADAVRTIRGPEVLRPVEELPGVSTNDTAQWGLAAIECLALLGAPPA
ncbi:MAG: twin-arginine translocation signal domain-containing protein [Opitutaceae bacterium]|nr:twin-arginine translocation signal domain-containing protein [Opitutaceae bacterium]